ncbi:uncharacterized protein [Euphorbia lathyris]|uniref:uncharacterized protein isoform X2 n=1 Tax=Euphorbia lathyris TaxID=212925 RepID=UPI0033139AFD
MLEKYKLEDNTWLSRLFDVKEKWALVYGRGTFSADITTTQRSESMNNSIKSQYISKRWRKDIKDQVPKVSYPNINDDDDDRKGKIARRYRDLARLHTELATIAAESDEAYEIASNALHMTLADVKTHLRTCQKPPEDTTVINNTTHKVVNDEFGEHIVKGIKAKGRISRKEDSIRPKNALEKLIRSKRSKKDVDTSPRHQREPQIDRSNVPSQCVDSIRSSGSQNQMNEQMPQYMLQNGIHPQFNSIVFPPGMQFTSPILRPNIQFASPYQYVQNLGGSNVGVPYQQGSMVAYQPLTGNWNRVSSISTISTEEHDLINNTQDEL